MATVKEKMISLKETEELNEPDEKLKAAAGREKQIVKTSVVGIIANAFLAAFKAVIGITTGSIAITLDAVNNLSDAAGSVITIVGTKFAGKGPDKKHPFGYGRIEYLTAMVISMIVLYAGVSSLKESVEKILHPEKPDYTAVALIIVAAGVIVKVILGRYVKSAGKKLKSDSLVNSGQEALLDSVISAFTLIAAFIFIFTGLSLEAWLGAIISVVIIKSGIEMLRDTLSQILGERADVELAKKIRSVTEEHEGVLGAYDLILHDYGPDIYHGSIHIEVDETMTADQIDQLIRDITVDVFAKCGVLITGVSVYAVNTRDREAAKAREDITRMVLEVPHALQVHGFYLLEAEKTIRFDVVISLGAPDRKAVYREIVSKVEQAYPGYRLEVVMDTDFSEE
ncbi:MAG: cation diffusion facilitator family transporter [Eubacteriales bacterium]|nr:cation diffusion facilitator family transporter [Eubacteriales bacterium]